MSFLTGTNVETIYASTAAGASLNTFTTEALLNTTATMGVQAQLPPSFWLPNQNMVGRGIKVLARGTLAATATPTYTVTVRGGAAGNITTAPILGGTAAMTTVSGATTCAWELEFDMIMKTPPTTGATATVTSVGRFFCLGLATTANNSMYGAAATPGTLAVLDTSIINFINVNVACSASSASNIFALQQLLVFGLN
jgi:hypothetical protein